MRLLRWTVVILVAIGVLQCLYERTEPEIKNCPKGHSCFWQLVDATDKICLKNCPTESK